MKHTHLSDQAIEFVLELLPTAERRQVEQQAAACTVCRQTLQQELALAQTVRATLQVATQPSPLRLRQLMPDIPSKRKQQWPQFLNLQRQFAPLALVLLIVLGIVGLNIDKNNQQWEQNLPAFLAATGTQTNTPTTTMTQIKTAVLTPTAISAISNNISIQTAVASSNRIRITPSPAPVPESKKE